VLVVQLISLQHVSWPRRNPTMNAKVAKRILDVHKDLLALIEIHDAAGARQLMDDHVKMIRARRVSEHKKSAASLPFVPAKAGTQSNGSGKLPLDSRLRGNERSVGRAPLKNFDCC